MRLAKSRGSKEGVEDSVSWLELGVLELDSRLPDSSFDVVTATFFSELSKEERTDALEVACSKLKNGGTLIIFDEAPPSGRFARGLVALIKILVLPLAWLIAQARTHPLSAIESMVRRTGFKIASQHRYLMGSLSS